MLTIGANVVNVNAPVGTVILIPDIDTAGANVLNESDPAGTLMLTPVGADIKTAIEVTQLSDVLSVQVGFSATMPVWVKYARDPWMMLAPASVSVIEKPESMPLRVAPLFAKERPQITSELAFAGVIEPGWADVDVPVVPVELSKTLLTLAPLNAATWMLPKSPLAMVKVCPVPTVGFWQYQRRWNPDPLTPLSVSAVQVLPLESLRVPVLPDDWKPLALTTRSVAPVVSMAEVVTPARNPRY